MSRDRLSPSGLCLGCCALDTFRTWFGSCCSSLSSVTVHSLRTFSALLLPHPRPHANPSGFRLGSAKRAEGLADILGQDGSGSLFSWFSALWAEGWQLPSAEESCQAALSLRYHPSSHPVVNRAVTNPEDCPTQPPVGPLDPGHAFRNRPFFNLSSTTPCCAPFCLQPDPERHSSTLLHPLNKSPFMFG